MNTKGKGYLIRRIRPSEAEILGPVFEANRTRSVFYPEHDKWFERAYGEILEEESQRIAFGLFDFFSNSGERSCWKLIAFVLIKRSEYDQDVEIKGPFADLSSYELDDSAISSKLREVEQSLLEKVIRFCEVRGYPRIEIELPQLDHERVSLALALDFKVIALREKYRAGAYVYEMAKTLGDTYQGDPFDLDKIADWFMTLILPCQRIATSTLFIDRYLVIRHIYTVPLARRHSDKYHKLDENDKRLERLANELAFKCQLVTVPPKTLDSLSQEQIVELYNEPNCVRYLLTDCSTTEEIASIKQKCEHGRIKLLLLRDLREFGGGKKSSFAIPFDESAVGGVITVLEPEHGERLHGKNGLVYFLMSDLGNGLDYETEPKLLAFYSPYSNVKEHLYGEFWGAAIIESTHNAPYDKAYDYYDDSYVKFLSEADLLFLQVYSEHQSVLCVKCSGFWKFDPPIALEDTLDAMGSRQYLSQQLVINTSSAAYVHNDLKKFFLKQPTIHMSVEKTNSSFLPQSVNWLRVIAESALGLPGGKILLGGLLKQYDSDKDLQKRNEMEGRIAALISLNKDLVLEQMETLFSEFASDPINLAALRSIPVILNEQVRSMKDGRGELSANELKHQLHVTSWPFPAIPESLLIKELKGLFKTRSDKVTISDLADTYEMHIQDNASLVQTLTDMVRSLPGRSPELIREIVAELLILRPGSRVLNDLLVFCDAIKNEQTRDD